MIQQNPSYTSLNPAGVSGVFVEEDGSGVRTADVGTQDKFVEDAEFSIRQGFIRKVFGILGIQLAVTSVIIAFFSAYEPAAAYVSVNAPDGGHPWVLILAFIISFACVLTLSCYVSQAKTYPNNYILLGVFTLAEGVLLGVICSSYSFESILIAAGITSLITLGLVAYAYCTTRDFTGAGPYLFMALWCLVLYGALLGFAPVLRSNVQTAYSLIGVVIFGFYIVYDVQLIVGGKHKSYRFGVDDHVFAALNVYLDIINLFIRILAAVGKKK